jgi:hypothetical protein
VIGGKDCEKFKSDYGISDNGFGKDIIFRGGFYRGTPICRLPTHYPSNAEAFPIPLTEARLRTPIPTRM